MNYDDKLKDWSRRRKRIISALKGGKDRGEVARKFGITRQRLHQIIRAEKAK